MIVVVFSSASRSACRVARRALRRASRRASSAAAAAGGNRLVADRHAVEVAVRQRAHHHGQKVSGGAEEMGHFRFHLPPPPTPVVVQRNPAAFLVTPDLLTILLDDRAAQRVTVVLRIRRVVHDQEDGQRLRHQRNFA